FDLAVFTPGTSRDGDPGQEVALSTAGLGMYSSQAYVDGAGATSTGAYSISGIGTIPPERVNLESVQEFKVETSNYSAEYGLHGGAQISVATKSGTNQLHGALFEYV